MKSTRIMTTLEMRAVDTTIKLIDSMLSYCELTGDESEYIFYLGAKKTLEGVRKKKYITEADRQSLQRL